MKKRIDEKRAKLLDLLKNAYALELVKKDPDFSATLLSAIAKVEKGESISLESARLAPLLSQYTLKQPCQELVDLQLFLQKEATNYRSMIGISSLFGHLP